MMIRKTLLSCALKKRATQLSAGSLMVLCLGTGAALVPLTVHAQNFESAQRQQLDSVVAVVNDGVIISHFDQRRRRAGFERQGEIGGASRCGAFFVR